MTAKELEAATMVLRHVGTHFPHLPGVRWDLHQCRSVTKAMLEAAGEAEKDPPPKHQQLSLL